MKSGDSDLVILRDIGLEVMPGESVAIVGASGSGKSTLIRCLNRLEEHQRGTIRVHGVELSNELHAIAQQNVRSYTNRVSSTSPIELVCADARTYELPRQNLVMFLYNPFVGEVLEDVATQVEKFLSAERADVWLLYRNPECADRVARIPGLTQYAESRSFRIYRRTIVAAAPGQRA